MAGSSGPSVSVWCQRQVPSHLTLVLGPLEAELGFCSSAVTLKCLTCAKWGQSWDLETDSGLI